MSISTPVAFIIFNRPDLTEIVFEAIAKARPAKLLVVADGPRADRPDDVEKCRAARAVVDRVDWDCEILKNYSDINLGCGVRSSTGITWVFENVEEAIILEDDCLPHPTFFPFCEELLERFRADERVMMISGDKFQAGGEQTSYSYYFSPSIHVWGWASWRRAWRLYDVEMKLWPKLRETRWLLDRTGDPGSAEHWRAIFDAVSAGRIDTWDYQWTFACWAHSGISVLPNTNLVSNIGFRDDATHTLTADLSHANLPIAEMVFPLRHPPDPGPNERVARAWPEPSFAGSRHTNGAGIFSGIRSKLSRLILKIYDTLVQM